MSRRLASFSSAFLGRHASLGTLRWHSRWYRPTTGGLLRSDDILYSQRRSWPLGSSSLHHAPAVRTISFARILPNIVLKALRLPALFGGGIIAGLAYIQYQATRKLYYITYNSLQILNRSLHQRLVIMLWTLFDRPRKRPVLWQVAPLPVSETLQSKRSEDGVRQETNSTCHGGYEPRWTLGQIQDLDTRKGHQDQMANRSRAVAVPRRR